MIFPTLGLHFLNMFFPFGSFCNSLSGNRALGDSPPGLLLYMAKVAEKHFIELRKLNVLLNDSLSEWKYKETINAYASLSKLLIAKIIVFNRIRAGEAARLTEFDFSFSECFQGIAMPPLVKGNVDTLTYAMKDEHFNMYFTTKWSSMSVLLMNDIMLERMRDIIRLRDALGLTEYLWLFCDPDNPELPTSGCLALKEAARAANPNESNLLTAHSIRENFRLLTNSSSSDRKHGDVRLYDSESDDE